MQRLQPSISKYLTLLALLNLGLLSLFVTLPVQAQNSTSGGIIGEILGPDDKPRPGIKVTATNALSGLSSTRTTDSDGIYRFDFLMPGNYRIKAFGLRYPDVTLTDIWVAHPSTTRIRLPDITLGRVQLIIQIVNRTRNSVSAVVSADNGSGKIEEQTKLNGEFRFLYLRDGRYKVDFYINGRRQSTLYLMVRFEDNPRYELPYNPPPVSQFFEIKGSLLEAIEGAINSSGQPDGSANAEPPIAPDASEPAFEEIGISHDVPSVSLPSQIVQTSEGTFLTVGRAVLVRQQADQPPGKSTTAPQATTAQPVSTGQAKVLMVNTTSPARSHDLQTNKFRRFRWEERRKCVRMTNWFSWCQGFPRRLTRIGHMAPALGLE